MRGVKGTFKSFGDHCATCGVVLNSGNGIARRAPREGLLSYCRPCLNARGRTPKAMEAHRRSMARQRQKYRQLVLRAYGGECACCGETSPEFLALDHVKGGGSRERRDKYSSPLTMYRAVAKAGFPDSYRLLCHNCNCALGWYGYCPHERTRNASSRAL